MRLPMMRTATGTLLLSLCGAAHAATADADPALVQRGAYLATAGDCAACHQNPTHGDGFSGGYALQSPLGTIYGSNITPSLKYGIGQYSLEDFTRVMRKGVAPGNHYLYPAMPYTAFAGMSDDDLKALYSYLMLGVKPVDKPAPETKLGFPFSLRPAMFFWNALFLNQGVVPGADAAPGSSERGEYLVKTLAHCSTCHTPRNLMMAESGDKLLAGGKVNGWTAPNITPDPAAGIGNWRQDEIVTYLKTGALHGKAIAAGEMGTAVSASFSKLDDSDLLSIARYLRGVPPINNGETTPRSGGTHSAPAPLGQIETGMSADIRSYIDTANMSGAQIYNGACAACHGNDGRGTQDAQHFYPSLVGSSAVGSADPANLIMTVAEGVNRVTPAGHAFMPAFANQFTSAELTKVVDYVSTAFGSPTHHVSQRTVEETLQSGQPNALLRYAGAIIWAGVAVVALGVAGFSIRRRKKRT